MKSHADTKYSKDNLPSRNGYRFRIRPSGNKKFAYLAPSQVVFVRGLSEPMKGLFSSLESDRFVRNQKGESSSLEQTLGGKEFVLLYASGSWCELRDNK